MATARDPAILRKLIGAGEDGLKRELLDQLPRPWHIVAESGEGYDISPPLLHAAQVALLLRQPLLLAGDAGVGKTRFAAALAARLQLELHRFHVKTTTSGRELLYAYDDVARFRDATLSRSDGRGQRPSPSDSNSASAPTASDNASGRPAPAAKPLSSYVRLNALGLAIIRSAGPGYPVTPSGFAMGEVAGEDYAARETITLGELFPRAFKDISQSTHSIVLIDELDKAPRDAPNDLLVEIEEMRFEIREIGVSLRAEPDYWPIVIVTSNSERSFPDPFLRRCVFHYLEFPVDRLPIIVASRVPGVSKDSRLVVGAIELFKKVREEKSLDKTPGTAELIAFIALLVDLGKDVNNDLKLSSDEGRQAAGVLGKTRRDEEKIRSVLQG